MLHHRAEARSGVQMEILKALLAAHNRRDHEVLKSHLRIACIEKLARIARLHMEARVKSLFARLPYVKE